MKTLALVLMLITMTVTSSAAFGSLTRHYGELNPRISQAEFEANQQETLDILIPMLKEFEGFSPKATRDKDGTFTICWGHTGKNINGKSTCNSHQGEIQLRVDANKVLAEVFESSPVLKTRYPSEQAAVADFAYNAGLGAYQRSSFKIFIDRGETIAAKQELKRWVYAKGRYLPGLVKRRNREIALLR